MGQYHLTFEELRDSRRLEVVSSEGLCLQCQDSGTQAGEELASEHLQSVVMSLLSLICQPPR